MNSRQSDIGHRTLRGMLWAFASYGGGRILVLLATAVLARILSPAEFGLVAAALTIISLFDSMSHLWLGQALIIEEDDEVDDKAETAFVGTIVAGVLVAAAVAALSPAIAEFFDEPELVGISIVLGGNFLLRSLGITHYSLAQRSIDFRARTIAELSEAAARGVVGIALAVAGLGAWSLVIGYLAGTIMLNLVIWRLVPWRPRFKPRREHLPRLLRFGGTLTGVDVMAGLIGNLSFVFVGRVLGTASLGAYQIASLVPRMAIANLAVVAGKVLFPAFAASGRASLHRAFLLSVRYVWLMALPGTVLLALLAGPVITVGFGDQWEPAVDPMRILAVVGFTTAMGFPAGTAYKATGRAGVLLALATTRFLVLLTALFMFTEHGLVAAAASVLGASLIIESTNLVLASRLLATPLRVIWREIVPALAGALAMAGPVVAVTLVAEPPVLELLAGAGVGLGTYAAAVRLLAPDALAFLLRRLGTSDAPRTTAPESVTTP